MLNFEIAAVLSGERCRAVLSPDGRSILMTPRAAGVLVVVALGWHGSRGLAHFERNARPYGLLRRRRTTTPCCFVASPLGPAWHGRPNRSTTATAQASPLKKTPWGVPSRARLCNHRSYSDRNWGGERPVSTDDDADRGPTGSAICDNFAGSVETGAVGGRALPLDVNRASKITSVKVDNLAMVDSVSIEVRKPAFGELLSEAAFGHTPCRWFALDLDNDPDASAISPPHSCPSRWIYVPC